MALLLGVMGIFATYQFINGIFTGSILEGGGTGNRIAGREIVNLTWRHTPILFSISMTIALATAVVTLLCLRRHFIIRINSKKANKSVDGQ